MFDAVLTRHGWSPDPEVLALAGDLASPLDRALVLALALAGEPVPGDLARWREALQDEARRRLYPLRFGTGEGAPLRVGGFFFPLAQAVLPHLVRPGSLAGSLPFEPLVPEECAAWPSGEEYGRLLVHLEEEGFHAALAMAQHWRGFSIQDHVLGVTGLALWIGRQLARSIPVDLPLLHGGAIGHDVGKFGCVGDEARRIPRLHYYYTHQYYAARGLGGLGHIATNHSCWDLELVRLPVETQVLIYCDFRVKDVKGPDGRWGMEIISLKEAFRTILDKLEDVDGEKRRRYQAVYRKLRDLEDYALVLGVDLDPPGHAVSGRARPYLPPGLDIVALMAGGLRPDTAALATGPRIPSTVRLLATAHNIGVMERLRDLPALRRLLEEARSFKGWRELRTYLAIVGDYAPAFSEEQRALALAFLRELLAHPDDDIRYQAAVRMGGLLALGEAEWRKDLPEGAVVEERPWVLPQVASILGLLDHAPAEAGEDMGPQEQVLYSVPVFLRSFFRHAAPRLAREVLTLVLGNLEGRSGERRPLAALYICESFEILLGFLDPAERERLPALVLHWAFHDAPNVRLMSWRVLHHLARHGQEEPRLLAGVGACVDSIAPQARPGATVAELYLLERCARLTGRTALGDRCRELRERGRSPIREVMLRNLKGQTGWVEKKVACDYLLSLAAAPREDGSAVAAEVAFHLANLLKVSRVEGTRFHAGRCLMELLPVLTDTQRNDLAIELVRSLQLDGEGVTRYLPRFLGQVMASLPGQELDELLADMEVDARRGSESLQRLLVQAAAWLVIALPPEAGGRIRRLVGILLGSLADTRVSVAHEGYAHVALLLDWLRADADPRLEAVLRVATKKTLTLLAHLPGDSCRFFLVAEALSSLDKGLLARPTAFPKAPSVGFLPGTFDPFTSAHEEMVRKALAHCDEVFVQVDDFSWRKHAQPRFVRVDLAWMALATIPEAFLFPFDPPVNIANARSLKGLRERLGRRVLHLVVGTDVLEGASAYRDPGAAVWGFPHLVTTREGSSRSWETRLEQFRAGVQVFQVGTRVRTVSSTSLREAFDRRGELELFCDPLVARTLRERRLYVNYPARKEEVFASQWQLRFSHDGRGLPPGLVPLSHLDARRALAPWTGRKPRAAELLSRETGQDLAAITWMEGNAAALPVALEDESLAEVAEGRLLGTGALVEAVGCLREDAARVHLDQLLSRIIGQWYGEGLLFSIFGVPVEGGERLWETLRHHGAGWLGSRASASRGVRWAGIELTHPLVMVHDLEQLLQHPYLGAGPVEDAILQFRRALSGFFADRVPGSGLLHVHEKEAKRQLAAWTRKRLDGAGPGWVVLGLGRQFSRDTIGDTPTVSLDLERFLTWQGYEAGVENGCGSPGLIPQLTTARELGRDAILLVPFLDSPEPVLQVQEACRRVRIRLREVLVGTTSASVRAALHLSGVNHRAALVVPHWRGVLRESAVLPFVGGWSIKGRPSVGDSLTPSLNDCLPYHDPHPLGLDPMGALDFSRLALEQAVQLFQTLEETFRRNEGRLLSLADLSAVVRHPRCPPFPQGFRPPMESAPSDLINQDLEALARLLPETHRAHREGWRRG